LLYLACVAALFGLFSSFIHGLMQPTVIPNVGLAGYKLPEPTKRFLQKPDNSTAEVERAAIDAAEAENRDQGIEPLVAFAAAEPVTSKPEMIHARTATAPRAKGAKPRSKHVARRDIVVDPWRSSWSAPWHSWDHERQWNRVSGLTGGRSQWEFGDRF
jgi:hypothetical protein